MEVHAELIESSIAESAILSTLEWEVNSLMQLVSDDYGLEVLVGLPLEMGHTVAVNRSEKVEVDDLDRRLAALKACWVNLCLF